MSTKLIFWGFDLWDHVRIVDLYIRVDRNVKKVLFFKASM